MMKQLILCLKVLQVHSSRNDRAFFYRCISHHYMKLVVILRVKFLETNNSNNQGLLVKVFSLALECHYSHFPRIPD